MPRKAQEPGVSIAALKQQLRASPMFGFPPLMLSTLVDVAFDDAEWLYEPKLDGLRVVCHCDGKSVQIRSRNNKPQETQFPEIVAALAKQVKHRAVLDGEIVCLDEHGRPSFRSLQQRFHLHDKAVVAYRMRQFPAYIYLFDLLYVDRYDIRSLPLAHRKLLLRQAVKWNSIVRWTDATIGQGKAIFGEECKQGGEGIVAKRMTSPYVGTRGGAWLKIKCSGRQEFVIGGFTEPRGSRAGLGALLVGYWSDDGRDFHYAGKVGTGFTDALLRDLREQLEQLEQQTSPFTAGKTPPRGKEVHWVKPKLVAEIAYAEWTRHDLLRQPRFEGLRKDKKPAEVKRERAAEVISPAPPSAATRGSRRAPGAARRVLP